MTNTHKDTDLSKVEHYMRNKYILKNFSRCCFLFELKRFFYFSFCFFHSVQKKTNRTHDICSKLMAKATYWDKVEKQIFEKV